MMNYSLNVCTSLSFDDFDILNYLDNIALPKEPTDEEGLGDESEELAMAFIKNNLLKGRSLEIDEEATKDSGAFEGLALRIEVYLYLMRHASALYEKISNNL